MSGRCLNPDSGTTTFEYSAAMDLSRSYWPMTGRPQGICAGNASTCNLVNEGCAWGANGNLGTRSKKNRQARHCFSCRQAARRYPRRASLFLDFLRSACAPPPRRRVSARSAPACC